MTGISRAPDYAEQAVTAWHNPGLSGVGLLVGSAYSECFEEGEQGVAGLVASGGC
jgi:hypothetical protein